MIRSIKTLLLTFALLAASLPTHALEQAKHEYKGIDRPTAMRATLVALQEMGFVIESLDVTQWKAESTRFTETPEPKLKINLALEELADGVVLQAEVLVNNKTVPFHHIAYHNLFQEITRLLQRMSNRVE